MLGQRWALARVDGELAAFAHNRLKRLLQTFRAAILQFADKVGFATVTRAAISPAVIGLSRSNCRICRRVGSARALKTAFIFLYLAKYRNMSREAWSSRAAGRSEASNRAATYR